MNRQGLPSGSAGGMGAVMYKFAGSFPGALPFFFFASFFFFQKSGHKKAALWAAPVSLVWWSGFDLFVSSEEGRHEALNLVFQ